LHNVYRMDEEYGLKPAWSLFDEQRGDARCEHCNRDAETVSVILIDVSCTQLFTIGSKKLNILYCPDHETIAEAVMSHGYLLSTTSESKRHVEFSLIMSELYRSLNVHSGIARLAFIQSVCAMQDVSNDRV
jgi:hypothetical protein